MSADRLTAVAFLVVALIGLEVQLWALLLLLQIRRRGGLLRTAICRAYCAVLYVAIGTNALFAHWRVLAVTFVGFCLTQATWQVNAWLDVRAGRVAHRRPRPY